MMEKLKKLLEDAALQMSDQDNPILVAAHETDDLDLLNEVARCLLDASTRLRDTVKLCESKEKAAEEEGGEKEATLKADDLEKIAAIAQSYDESGDPSLMETANVFDMVLQTLGRQSLTSEAVDVDALTATRTKLQKEEKNYYASVKPVHEKLVKSEEAKKLIADRVKHYRPQEHALQTRSCPDHPGSQPVRVADGVWQCMLDGKMYNYKEGYSSLKGEVVPGGDVSLQNQTMHELDENTAFDSRVNRLNQ